MHLRFRMTTAAGVLLAAAAMGKAEASAPADATADLIVPPAHVYNTDNGVHAVPSGHVEEAPLTRVQRISARPANIAAMSSSGRQAGARLIAASASHAAPDKAEVSARLGKLPVQLADATPPPAPVTSAADVASNASASTPEALAAPVDPPKAAARAAPPAAPATEAAPVVRRADADAAPEPSAEDIGPEEARAYGLPAPPAVAPQPEDPAAHDPAMAAARPLPLADAAAPAPQPVEQPMQQRVAFPRRSAEAAAAFDRYMRQVSGIAPGMKSGSDVANALGAASAYEPAQFEEGMIAYGAIAALQDARFVYAVMDAAARPASRQALVEELLSDPAAAEQLPGAGEAAAMAGRAILSEAKPLLSTGAALKQEAYDVQHEAWSLAKADDGPGRLARAKAASAERIAAQDGDVARLLGRISDAKDDGGFPSAGAIADRSLALAALAILDGADGQDPSRLGGLLSEASSAECLKMSKLNLFQCLSVAGPEYEDVFCLGQHAVLDTARCVADAAGPADNVQLTAMGGGGGRASGLMSQAPR